MRDELNSYSQVKFRCITDIIYPANFDLRNDSWTYDFVICLYVCIYIYIYTYAYYDEKYIYIHIWNIQSFTMHIYIYIYTHNWRDVVFLYTWGQQMDIVSKKNLKMWRLFHPRSPGEENRRCLLHRWSSQARSGIHSKVTLHLEV